MPTWMRRRAETLPLLLEHRARRAQLVERRDHREHHRARCRRAARKDRAQLRAQQLRTVQQHADAALAEKRVVLARHRQVRQRLVAADVERADDQPASRARARARCRGRRRLLLLGRRASSGPGTGTPIAAGRRLGAERDRPAARRPARRCWRRLRRGGRRASTAGSCARASSALRSRACSSWRWWMRGDVARSTGSGAACPWCRRGSPACPFGEVERARVDPGDRRDVERPREDRDVRRRAARRRAEAEHVRAIQRRRCRTA